MYADSLTVAEARARYFADNGFTEATYTDPWVKLKVGPVPFAFPNTTARKAAVKLHDLHHVATDYRTTWTGEGEIAAWEIGAGCGRYGAAWLLNLSAMAIGLAIAPRAVFRAFVRGRHSKSLYDRAFADDLLALRVGELRALLRLDQPAAPASAADRLAFAVAVAGALATVTGMVMPVALVIAWLA
ncbi:MAG TPA: hypothetical protein VFQ53_02595 [Kofleriaceae bacterium]|nr:hypothetical protein [Kofleriaceae bacterium]